MSSTGRGSEKIEQDNYPTPRYAIEALVGKIDFTDVSTFCEPCKGDGRILDYIPSTVTKDWYEIREGRDYLNRDRIPINKYDLIITNPPFSKSVDFLINSLIEAKVVCYLQRINWLGAQKRKDFWNSNIPDKMFVLSERPKFIREYLKMVFGDNVNLAQKARELNLKLGTDSTEYAWFIWDKLGIVNGKHIEIL
jgi:hypothetical protein